MGVPFGTCGLKHFEIMTWDKWNDRTTYIGMRSWQKVIE